VTRETSFFNSNKIIPSVNSSAFREPYIFVTILGVTMPAYLDNGSTITIGGDLIISLVQKFNISIKNSFKLIRFIKGEHLCKSECSLTIDYDHGSTITSVHLIPQSIPTILLGRDFIGSNNIGIFIGQQGWSQGPTTMEIVPFISRSNKNIQAKVNPVITSPSFSHIDFSPELTEYLSKPFYSPSLDFLPENNLPFQDSIPSQNQTHQPSSICEDENDSDFFMDRPEHVLANWEYYEDLDDFKPKQDPVAEVPIDVLNPDFLSAPTYLTEQERDQLKSVLSEFTDMFTSRPGLCKIFQHRILTGHSPPVVARLRPITPARRKIYDQAFNELLEYDVIEPATNCPWSSTAFCVPKPDGSPRFVLQYKPLNAITLPDKYPIPRMDDMLSFLGNFKYISLFDLSKGFHQIEVAPEDRQKTAFISHRGHWQFKRLPMGLINSPATFQRMVDAVLGELKWVICFGYFDDVCIFSNSFEEHLMHIRTVLNKLRDNGLTINPKKVQLCRIKLKFLGYIIFNGQTIPNPEKVEAIHNFKRMKCVRDVRKFLGLLGFYRRLIPEMAKISQPLLNLLRKDAKFEFTEKCEEAFNKLKTSITELSKVYLPDLNKPFIISSDGSLSGLGAVLAQEYEGERYPIYWASRRLSAAEQRYSSPEFELLAVIWAIEKFSGYIEFTHFILETDHQAIMWLQRMKEPQGRLGRWYFKLQSYDFEVRHRPGTSAVMKVPDALSRTYEVNMIDIDSSFCRELIINEQLADSKMTEIREFISDPSNPSKSDRLRAMADRIFLMDDGMLMRYVGPKGKPWEDEKLYWRIWLPASLIPKAVSIFHETPTAGHMGIRKTYFRLEEKFYWFSMRRDVSNFVRQCLSCQEIKAKPIPVAPASSFHPQCPWDLVFTDLMGPYPRTAKQNTHLLVVVCGFSKWVELFPMNLPTSIKVTDKLWEVCCRTGVFRTLVTDNGSQFTSGHYFEWCKSLNIAPFHISAYHAQANMTERYNATIKNMIISFISSCKDWDKHLHEIAFAQRTAVNDTTKFTPAFLATGKEFRTPFDNLLGIVSSDRDVNELGKRMNLIYDLARENTLHNQEISIRSYNKKSVARNFNVGDLVMYRTHFLSNATAGFTSKLAPRWEGPYKIIERVSSYVFDLCHEETGQLVNKVHTNDLTLFLPVTNKHLVSKDRPSGMTTKLIRG
jgi:hypothetical protein